MNDARFLVESLQKRVVNRCHNMLLPDAMMHITDESERKHFEFRDLLNAQSLGFTCDLVPLFQAILRHLQSTLNLAWGSQISLLDVGTRTAAGAELLANIFGGYSSVHLAVDVCDLDPAYKEYSDIFHPHIKKFLVQDAFTLNQVYDLVLVSHTIEHIAEPSTFAKAIASLARYGAIFYCPFNEKKPIQSHYTVTLENVREWGAVSAWVIDSWWWRHVHPEDGPQKCIAFVLPGIDREAITNLDITYTKII
jgi:hypothetical protein